MDPDTFLNRIRKSLIDLIRKETRGRSVRALTSMWIRFRKDEDLVELVFNSLMTNVYNLNNLDEIVLEIINNVKYQKQLTVQGWILHHKDFWENFHISGFLCYKFIVSLSDFTLSIWFVTSEMKE